MRVFVWADGKLIVFADIEAAVTRALELAAVGTHPRVGVDVDPDGARHAAARALPGMVVCPRRDEFLAIESYPLTERVAMVCAR